MNTLEYVRLRDARASLVRHTVPAGAGTGAFTDLLRDRAFPLALVHGDLASAKDRVRMWHDLMQWVLNPAAGPAPENLRIVEGQLLDGVWTGMTHTLDGLSLAHFEELVSAARDASVALLPHDLAHLLHHQQAFEALREQLHQHLRQGAAAEAALWAGIVEEVVEPDTEDAEELANDTAAFRRAAQRRDWLIATERWLSSEAIAQAARGAVVESNTNQYAYQLRHKRQIFGVRHQRQRLHPACQFTQIDGRLEPVPVMTPLLELLPNDDSGWTQAFWLFQPSGRLDGARPADVLVKRPDDVLAAATKDRHGDTGI